MAKLGGFVLAALAALGVAACTTTTGGQGGGSAGAGLQPAVAPSGMSAAQGAAYCSKLAQTYAEYVGTVGGYLGGVTTGGEAADLDAQSSHRQLPGRQLRLRHPGAAGEAARRPGHGPAAAAAG